MASRNAQLIIKIVQLCIEMLGLTIINNYLLLKLGSQITICHIMQLDTFYNGVSQADQNSLNSSSGGNFLNRTTNMP